MRICLICRQYTTLKFCCDGKITVNLSGLVDEASKIANTHLLNSHLIEREARGVVTAYDCYHDDTKEEVVTGFDFLGELPNKVKIAVSGPAGHGKSTFALKFGNQVAAERGKLLYLSVEEGEKSPTMRKKLKLLDITTKNMLIYHDNDIERIIRYIITQSIEHVFIDSVSRGRFDNDSLNRIYEIIDGMLLYVIYQNKEGSMAGESEFQYDCDIIITVTDGIAATEKNRHKDLDDYDIFGDL